MHVRLLHDKCCFSFGHRLSPRGEIFLLAQNGKKQLLLPLNEEGAKAHSGGQPRAVDIAPRLLPAVLGKASLSRGLLGAGWASLESSCQC